MTHKERSTIMKVIKTDKIVKTYKYRIYPNNEQAVLLSKTFGCTRFVWNQTLDKCIKDYKFYLLNKNIEVINPVIKPSITGFKLANQLPNLKIMYSWLNEISAVALQQKMFDLSDSFGNFFKNKKGYPKFKSKHDHQAFRLMTTGFRFKDNELYIAKSKDPLKIKLSRELPSLPTSLTITKNKAGQYHACFICEYIPKKTNGMGQIGIDLGLKDFLVTNDGLKIFNPKYFRQSEKKLARLQRQHSRKKKGSNNRNKSRIKVAKCYLKISNQRNDFLHKLSTKLINENQVISMESLKVKNMVRNHKLSKSISDVGWGLFSHHLQYKAKASQHCKIIMMDQYFPSTHICSGCKTKLGYKLSLKDREWTCPSCGSIHDRDTNAASVIKIAGMDCHEIMPNTYTLGLARSFTDLVNAGLFKLATV